MLELRLAEGMDLAWLKERGLASAEVISGLIAEELIDGTRAIEGKLFLTLRGRLLADLVVRRVLNF